MVGDRRRVLVTGGGTFLGDNIAAALLAEGAQVTLLVGAGREHEIGPLAERTQWYVADLYDSASLRGRARGHSLVIHTLGSMLADPVQGLNHQRLNFVTTRNAATMCVTDGVPELLLLSSASAPWLDRRYIRAKREAEAYLRRVGIKGTIVRAPIVFRPHDPRPPLFLLASALGSIPPLSWLWPGRIAPMRADIFARGIARLALEAERNKQIYYASDLRRRNKQDERTVFTPQILSSLSLDDTQPHPAIESDAEPTAQEKEKR